MAINGGKKMYYVDLNVIYAFVDYLAPKHISSNRKDLKARREALIDWYLQNYEGKPIKLMIARSVYIE